jgi:hypothetical protein
MADHPILVALKQCMRNAKTPADRAACEAAFVKAGGTVSPQGGKVFTAPDGSTGYVTNGGKVFSS